MKITASGLKKGQYIMLNSEIWQVVKTDFNYRGRGSANVKARIKNILTGATIEHTTKSEAQFDVPDIEQLQVQFLYKDGSQFVFMDGRTYEQYHLSTQTTGTVGDYLKEGESVYILLYNDAPISMRPPQTVKLKVIAADDAVKGDTATAPKKTATVETGVAVKVPLFIKKGDSVVIDTTTGLYVSRGE